MHTGSKNRSWSILRTQSHCPEGRGLSTASLALRAPVPTLDRLGGHWTCAYKNIVAPQKGDVTASAVAEHVLEAGY